MAGVSHVPFAYDLNFRLESKIMHQSQRKISDVLFKLICQIPRGEGKYI